MTEAEKQAMCDRLGLNRAEVTFAAERAPPRMGYDVPGAVDYQPGDMLVQGIAGYPTHPFTYVLRLTDKGLMTLPLRNWLAKVPEGYSMAIHPPEDHLAPPKEAPAAPEA